LKYCCFDPPLCGDNVVEYPETCDPPGVPAGGSICREDCTFCGDGELNGPPDEEECDDGNNIDGDGCAADCTVDEVAIPAVSQHGAILLALLLLAAATSVLVWRRRAV
jgi:cysteine-rich repeat protein